MEHFGLKPADILLPKGKFEKFSVIACDQYTSEPDYWEKVNEITKDEVSARHIILPEIYLNRDVDKQIESINRTMQKYIDNYGANPESNKKRKDNIGLGSFKGEYADSSTTNEPEFVLTGIITETTSDMKAKEEEQIEEVVTEAEESSDVKDETVSEDTDTDEENPDNLIRFMPAAAELPHVKEAIKKYTDKSGVEIRNGFMEEISNATDSDIEPVLDKTSNEEDIKFTNMMNRRNEKANMSAY